METYGSAITNLKTLQEVILLRLHPVSLLTPFLVWIRTVAACPGITRRTSERGQGADPVNVVDVMTMCRRAVNFFSREDAAWVLDGRCLDEAGELDLVVFLLYWIVLVGHV